MKTRPYIIISPTYCASAGVRVLHLLCHELNTLGFDAKLLLTHNLSSSPDKVLNPLLNTPCINNYFHEQWEEINSNSIVICPDGVPGVPFGAKRLVRYILGKENTPPDPTGELNVYYSRAFPADKSGQHRFLHLLPFNLALFNDNNSPPRDQDMLWLGKGARFCTQRPANTIDITYSWPASQEELAANLRKTRYLYSYDAVSSTNTEAILCGAIVILKHISYHDSSWSREDMERTEHGIGGFAFNDSDIEINRAIASRHETVDKIRLHMAKFRLDLLEFVDESQRFFLV